MNPNLEAYVNKIKNHPPRIIGEDDWKEYSVLIPLLPDGKGDFSILFEVRSAKLSTQPGEVSFPGGYIEPGESPEKAAVRETCEELLISPESLEILGHPYTYVSTYGRKVDCFLGVLEGYEGTFSPDEVDEVFAMPLRALAMAEPRVYASAIRELPPEDFPYEEIPGGRDYAFFEGRSFNPFYHYQGKVIWGLTGRILHRLQQDLFLS